MDEAKVLNQENIVCLENYGSRKLSTDPLRGGGGGGEGGEGGGGGGGEEGGGGGEGEGGGGVGKGGRGGEFYFSRLLILVYGQISNTS